MAANWQGPNLIATRRQLLSTSAGLYDDLKDFSFSTIQASTLTVPDWISTSVLYVSDIQGASIDISGVTISQDGVFNAPIVSLSSLSFKGTDKLLDLDVSFDLGLGDAVGGLLGGLGALVGGAFIGVGTGVGLTVSGAEQGIATLIAGRPQNFINSNVYETINFTTQLQVSTLGNAYPLYSTIIRTVSSTSADQVPGPEIFVSTFFNPGTTCIRSVSDPFNLISGNSNLNTSTIQSFGQWTPLPEQVITSNFPGIVLSNDTDDTLLQQYRKPPTSNQFPMMNSLQDQYSSNFIYAPKDTLPFPNYSNISKVLYHRDEYQLSNTYISSTYAQFQSTITLAPTYFITSSISTPALFTWDGLGGGNFAIVQPDETGFRSTATFDFAAFQTDLLVQWGLAANGHNSTIAAGTSKRVSWDILANTSNFIEIPQAVSSFSVENTQQILQLQTNPYEIKWITNGTAMNPTVMAWDVNGMTFGSTTALSNYGGYPYQFNSSVFINGTLEAQSIVALSTIFATSTFIETQISTASIFADFADIPELYGQEGFFSTLKASSNFNNDYIHLRSRTRAMGIGQPFSIVTGKNVNGLLVPTDETARFDFATDQTPQAMYIQSWPNNQTIMTFLSTGIQIQNLDVANLTANSIVYSNADVPNLQTSSITFGWTGNFDTSVTPDFALQQSLTTPTGIAWANYQAASNQVLNLMAFSNSVTMIAQQFSTPLTYINNSFGGSNIQGWASTIFYNAQTTPCRVNLVSGAGHGELSLQGQTYGIIVNLNTPSVSGLPVNVPVGSTYKFTCDGTTWSTDSNAPTPGFVQYNNRMNLSMDFETVNLSTSDTLTIAAEQINLLGRVVIPDSQLTNLYVNNFVSANQLVANADPSSGAGLTIERTFTGSWNDQGVANPVAISNVVNSVDFLNNRTSPLINPNRGFNAFNSYNVGEWNNSMFYVDTTASSYLPTIILGDLIIKNPVPTYSGQFFINNSFDFPSSNIPVYVNREGLLSTIGAIAANTYARLYTTTGADWAIESNIPNPISSGPYGFSNFYTMNMNSLGTTVSYNAPVTETLPSRIMTTNKIIMDCPQVRVYTIESPSFVSREAGFEFSSYFDANVVFGEGESADDSDALNPILNAYSNYYYSVAGWSPQIWISRIRTASFGIQGYDIDAVVGLVSGTAGDLIWYSARYLNVVGAGSPVSANIRENYFMTPKNYHTSFGWLGQI